MYDSTPNKNIECTITQCAHHSKDCNCCCLDKISIGTHEANPTVCECTDCKSFLYKG